MAQSLCSTEWAKIRYVVVQLAVPKAALTEAVSPQAGVLSEHGFFCSNNECMAPLSLASVAVQLDIQLRRFIAKFYEAWLVCDETTCGNRTRMMSVYGKKCLVAGCRGAMHAEVSPCVVEGLQIRSER